MGDGLTTLAMLLLFVASNALTWRMARRSMLDAMDAAAQLKGNDPILPRREHEAKREDIFDGSETA